jgi:NADH-quinone oxidoreductase subunit N
MKTELMITSIIIFLLFARIGGRLSNRTLFHITNFLLLFILMAGFLWPERGWLFGDMFYTNPLRVLEKGILIFGVLVISLASQRWLLAHRHMHEFYLLMLAALLGMCFMISSGNLLMFYLALELSTIPVAALCNFDLDRKVSSEAALKMIMSSAFSSALLLLGISFFYGATGTISLHLLPGALHGDPLEIAAFVLLFSGFAFKLSVVPFHLWTADVYEGSPVSVTSFLSVISKGSVAFVFLTFLQKIFLPLFEAWYLALFLSSLATMFIGNLFALRQQNIKRFLAFSSIAQVGFILLGMSGLETGIPSVVYFILVYLFSNLGAFTVVGIIRSATGRESIADYNGLYKTNPWLSWALALCLFSLAGIPPTAGFFGKIFLLTSGSETGNFTWVTLAALNMVISLYYYLRIVRAMFMSQNDRPIEKIKAGVSANAALAICVAGVLLAGVASSVYKIIDSLVY